MTSKSQDTTARQRVAELWRDAVHAPEVGDDADFADSGGTSLAAVYLAAQIQEEFEIEIDAIEVIEHSQGGLAELVESRLADRS